MEINAYLASMKDEFREKFGLEFISAYDGCAIAEYKVRAVDMNPLGFIYGGVCYNLADIVAGVSFFSTGAYGPTVEGSMKYLSGSDNTSKLRLEGNVIRNGNSLGFIEVDVKDERGKLIQKGSFTYFNAFGVKASSFQME
ncbi:MAG: PaaI family thioesterase [Sphaerochaetaceae bacterium]|nr:PaaI family thioesterase [Sphaerochaetaceae bacterium]